MLIYTYNDGYYKRNDAAQEKINVEEKKSLRKIRRNQYSHTPFVRTWKTNGTRRYFNYKRKVKKITAGY